MRIRMYNQSREKKKPTEFIESLKKIPLLGKGLNCYKIRNKYRLVHVIVKSYVKRHPRKCIINVDKYLKYRRCFICILSRTSQTSARKSVNDDIMFYVSVGFISSVSKDGGSPEKNAGEEKWMDKINTRGITASCMIIKTESRHPSEKPRKSEKNRLKEATTRGDRQGERWIFRNTAR